MTIQEIEYLSYPNAEKDFSVGYTEVVIYDETKQHFFISIYGFFIRI
ncbi:MAG: hypothetical protein K6A72_09820 [Lachnospiraceae bacterium]|nr:hypothetical protein [Lachnospiraceae bacterium]